jgi:divinyl chlorophyllide a 8-vinyl-reductase
MFVVRKATRSRRLWWPLADVRFGDVMSMESLRSVAFKDKVDVVVSCLASRTGGHSSMFSAEQWTIDI